MITQKISLKKFSIILQNYVLEKDIKFYKNLEIKESKDRDKKEKLKEKILKDYIPSFTIRIGKEEFKCEIDKEEIQEFTLFLSNAVNIINTSAYANIENVAI